MDEKLITLNNNLPKEVIIVNSKFNLREIRKEITIPFIPPNGMKIEFPIQIDGELRKQVATVEYCIYSMITNTIRVQLIASDDVIDCLLESGGFSKVRY